MKSTTILPLLLAFSCASLATTLPTNTVSGHVTLQWRYPTNRITDDLRFQLYQAPDLTLPLDQWTPLASVAATNFAPYQVDLCGTNWMATNLTVQLEIQPGAYFFVGTASNFWGETSITSNVVATPPAPVVINDSLRIRKAP